MPEQKLLSIGQSFVQVTITDLHQILANIDNACRHLHIPGFLADEQSAYFFYSFQPKSGRLLGSRTAHEVQQTALEMVLLAEVQRRLGFLLALKLRATLELDRDDKYNLERATFRGAAGECQVFDLANYIETPDDCCAEFEVFDIRLNSPIISISTLKKIIVTSTLVIQLTTFPVTTEAPSTTVNTILESIQALSNIANAGNLGYSIFLATTPDRKLREQLYNTNVQQLSKSMSTLDEYGHSKTPDFLPLQQLLSRLKGKDGSYYYDDIYDGKYGAHLANGIARFASDYHLRGVTYSSTDFVNSVSDVAAKEGLSCG